MAGGELLVSAWKEWGLQVLVLLSFTFQVALLILAELRRRMDSGVLRAFVWSAYLLADATAIYVLGHMSVARMSPEHELTAFWAPFLLLHLGGQDNITAYAIEDNRLWLRHLQTLAVQVAGAAYILYQSSIVGGDRSSSSFLWPASILMFGVGVVKYGERVWALRRVGTGPSGSNYRSFNQESGTTVKPNTIHQDREAILLRAHLLLDVPKDFINGPLRYVAGYSGTLDLRGDELYEVVEMQLSLMHDVLYTKTEVMHTWYGICIHTFSLLGTAAALTLVVLHLSDEHKAAHRYNRADVAVTYILLVGAVVLEATSAVRAALSSWTCALLAKRSFHARGKARKTWDCLGRAVASIRRLARAAEWRRRYWSGCMGQHNLLRLCTRSRASRISKMARWIGVEDPWNTLAFSGPSVRVSTGVKQLVLTRVLQSSGNLDSSTDHVNGGAALKRRRLYEAVSWIIRDMELEQSILVWHIATDIYVGWYKEQAKRRQDQGDEDDARADLAQAVEALSNYMVFLLAERSYMLPPPTSRDAYVGMCYVITGLETGGDEDLPSVLRRYGNALNAPEYQFDHPDPLKRRHYSFLAEDLLEKGSRLGAKFIATESQDSPPDMLEMIAEVWVELLCYVSYRCSADSHAKQLSSGGEFVTVTALLMKYIKRRIVSEYPLISG